MRFSSLRFVATCIAMCTAASAFAADSYPAKPVKVIVPWTAGQATDAAARAVAERLGSSMKQPFIIDNRAGAGGGIGSDAVAKSPPDGYTLLAGSTGSVTVNPLLSKTNYDADSFAPAGLIATVPYVLITAESFPAKDAKALVALLQANPGKYSFASSGNGSIGHLISELFVSKIGAKASHIPYKGSSGAIVDVIAGRVDFMFDSVTSVLPHVKSGKVRAYALSSAKRSTSLPDIAPLATATDLRDFDLYAWIGLMAPKGTAEPVLNALNRGIQDAVMSKLVKDQYLTLGIETVEASTPAEMSKLIAVERVRLGSLIKASNIKAD
ncbi:Bug family tripartite tricarboxylate transporter substrate binding protein [Variovorax ginsengisoli]|uniref:Tripartite tricarboxylate transporter substrate-binding protein n=1 Tax=Variovorax ginsengisoli TaxID=363844 RepID=A0ABT8S9A9_9BURK|nr:tripartite tricarboxylate transporter substrate-binding protein [Variovorax ginsengisoli]MDN8615642.1 tripartite tricarboxylate transporter substrate-binding protein [Variovorax ginsengisoli]MDO1534812.1 tripartite tricarboxylate transporter substrate-binding protein [Variovorax ginsengisoli]